MVLTVMDYSVGCTVIYTDVANDVDIEDYLEDRGYDLDDISYMASNGLCLHIN